MLTSIMDDPSQPLHDTVGALSNVFSSRLLHHKVGRSATPGSSSHESLRANPTPFCGVGDEWLQFPHTINYVCSISFRVGTLKNDTNPGSGPRAPRSGGSSSLNAEVTVLLHLISKSFPQPNSIILF